MPDERSQVFVVRIRAPMETVWDEITRMNVTKPAMFNTKLIGKLQVGARIEYVSEVSGKPELVGEILEVDPPGRFVHTFRFAESADDATRVTYELKQLGTEVELVVTHDRFARRTGTFERVSLGWPRILEGIKSLAERAVDQHTRAERS